MANRCILKAGKCLYKARTQCKNCFSWRLQEVKGRFRARDECVCENAVLFTLEACCLGTSPLVQRFSPQSFLLIDQNRRKESLYDGLMLVVEYGSLSVDQSARKMIVLRLQGSNSSNRSCFSYPKYTNQPRRQCPFIH
ncbi:conserved hypothetical protein [Trichinella spiralis]|uniref:hypothetical protein n=1 Tax=Trichinella spiralis TaxID=6334 RepID=UPI0001EFC58C|nr:conserved hypothetical protein [Trichinella spiralis]